MPKRRRGNGWTKKRKMREKSPEIIIDWSDYESEDDKPTMYLKDLLRSQIDGYLDALKPSILNSVMEMHCEWRHENDSRRDQERDVYPDEEEEQPYDAERMQRFSTILRNQVFHEETNHRTELEMEGLNYAESLCNYFMEFKPREFTKEIKHFLEAEKIQRNDISLCDEIKDWKFITDFRSGFLEGYRCMKCWSCSTKDFIAQGKCCALRATEIPPYPEKCQICYSFACREGQCAVRRLSMD